MASLHEAVFHRRHLLGNRQLKSTTLRRGQGNPEILTVQLKLETKRELLFKHGWGAMAQGPRTGCPLCRAATKSLIGKPSRWPNASASATAA